MNFKTFKKFFHPNGPGIGLLLCLCLAFCSTTPLLHAGQRDAAIENVPTLTEKRIWGYGDAHVSQIEGNRLYAGIGRMLCIYDITLPAQPSLLGEIPLKSVLEAIEVQGNYAYISTRDYGLQVVQVDAPASPQVVANLPIANAGKAMILHDHYLYFGCQNMHTNDYRFFAVNISNPLSPGIATNFPLSSPMFDMVVSGQYLYAASEPRGITVWSLQDPAVPTKVGQLPHPFMATPISIAAVGSSYLYVAIDDYVVQVVNISTPTTPVLETDFGNPGYGMVKDVFIRDNTAYLAVEMGLAAWDITNPAAPVEVFETHYPGSAHHIDTDSDILALSHGYAGVKIVDISTPHSPQLTGNTYAAGKTLSLASAGSFLAVASNYGGMHVVQNSSGTNSFPTRSVRAPAGCVYTGLVYPGFYTYVIDKSHDHEPGLVIYDLHDPSNPVEAAVWRPSMGGSILDVRVSGNYAYLPLSRDGIQVLDVSNPAAPSEIALIPYSNANAPSSAGLWLENNRLYASVHRQGFYVIDVSTPSSPVVQGFLSEYYNYALDVCVVGEAAYVADGSAGMRIIDIADPANPIQVGQYNPSPIFCRKLTVIGAMVFMADDIAADNSGMRIVDCSDPATPLQLAYYPSPDRAKDVWGFGMTSTLVCNNEAGFAEVDTSGYWPAVSMLAPSWDETLYSGSTYEIRWNRKGIAGKASLYYTVDNGPQQIIAENVPNSGACFWTVPNIQSANMRIKIQCLDRNVYTYGNRFAITSPATMTVIAPNGGETWAAGVQQELSWGSTGIGGNVAIDYSLDNGVSWLPVTGDTENDGSYLWTPPAQASSQYKIRVRTPDNSVMDTSDAPFTVELPVYVNLLSPNGGEEMVMGSLCNIAWENGNSGNFLVELSVDNGSTWESIGSGSDSWYFQWLVKTPNNSFSTQCRVRVTVDGYSDSSESAFTISQPTAVDQVPIMTSNTAPYGAASASSIFGGSYDAWKAFDGDDVSGSASRWISGYFGGGINSQWLSYRFRTPQYITHYYLLPELGTLSDRAPRDWQLQGWDGSAWVAVDSRANIDDVVEWRNAGLYFEVAAPAAFYQYRLYVTGTNGSDVVSIRRLKLLGPQDMVPVMISDTSPTGIASASTNYNNAYRPWKAFDGEDISGSWSRWISKSRRGFSDPQWLAYDFGTSRTIRGYYVLPEYSSSLKSRSPKDWQLQGWNGSSWVTVDTRSNIRIDIEWNYAGLYFNVTTPGAYTKYRLYVTAVNGSSVVSIRQLKLFN